MPKNRRFDTFGNELFSGENQRKDGRYCFRWTDNGQRKYLYANTLEELRLKEYNTFKDITYLHLGDTVTLNQVYENWISTKILRDGTYSNYQYSYKKHIYNSSLGIMDIKKIKKSDIKKLYIYLYKDYYNENKHKYGLSYSSIENINQILYQVFKAAIDDRIIDYNPCSTIMKDLNGSGSMQGRKKNVKVLTVEEQAEFVRFCKNPENKIDSKWLNIFIILLCTGLRIGELSALTWDDIDFNNNKIYVRKNITYRKRQKTGKCEIQVENTKTETSDRVIEMISVVRDILLNMKETAISEKRKSKEKVSGYDNFIFLNKYKMPYKSRMVNLRFSRILEQHREKHSSGKDYIPIKKFTCHTLRHNAAEDYLNATHNDFESTRAFLGHSRTDTLFFFYTPTDYEKLSQNTLLFEDRIIQKGIDF